MKVVQLNCTYGNQDSTGRNVFELHHHFLNQGDDSYVFASVLHEDEPDGTVQVFSSGLDRKIHGICSRVFGRQGYFSVCSTKKLIRQLAKISPDIVMLHVLHSNCINLPMLFRYLSKNNIAVVLVLHDCWYYTGHCCHYIEDQCTEWTRECRNCRSLKKWNKSYFFDNASSNLMAKKEWYKGIENLAVIGVSDWITNEAKKSILKDAKIIERIYNWVDQTVFYPRDKMSLRKKYGFPVNRKILLGVSSVWNERKGLTELIETASALEDCEVILVGRLSDKHGLPDNVHVVGEIKGPDILAEYYAMADVFLNPSIQETFGKTTAEALACGIPAIVYNTSACAELVKEGCGIVVPILDRKEYIAAVSQLIRCNSESYSERCRQHAVSNFSADKCMADYYNILENMVCL